MNYNVTLLTVLTLFFLTLDATAQKAVADLPPAHAAALQHFLTKHDGLEFLSETALDQTILKSMRKSFGPNFNPFYRTGDFNKDGLSDFAVVLAKKGGPTGDQGSGIAETHRYLYDLTIVIFNGRRGAYTPAFVKTMKTPLVSFLNVTYQKKKLLTFGVYETDEGFIMSPAGKGYIIEYADK